MANPRQAPGTATLRYARLPLPLALALQEIRNSRGFAVGFVLSVSLGLVGFLTLDSVRRTLKNYLEDKSRSMLGADLGATGEIPLTPEQVTKLRAAAPTGTVWRHETTLLSMVKLAGGDTNRLVQIQGVDQQFPFYGSLELQVLGKKGPGAGALLTGTAPAVWVDPDLFIQLNAKLGDELQIGDERFQITDVIVDDPSSAGAGLTYAPKVIIAESQVAQTGLVQKGSRINYRWFAKLADPAQDAERVVKTLEAALLGATVRIKSHRSASEEIFRLQLHLSDYLGLVALVALFLAAVGGAYLFRSFLERRTKDLAVLRSLGLNAATLRLVYMFQLLVLGSLAVAMTILLCSVLMPLAPAAFGSLLPPAIRPHLTWQSVVAVILLGNVGSLLACLPLLVRAASLKAQTLFQEAAQPSLEFRAKNALWWLPALVGYWLLAVWTARSWLLGSVFVGIFLAAVAIFAAAALLLMRVLKSPRIGELPLPVALAALGIARHRLATLASFIALSLGAMLVNLIPQVSTVLERELSQPTKHQPPSLFLFDIQTEQLAPLTTALAAVKATLELPSPMIRARLVGLNGKDLTQIPASDPRSKDQNRGYNLTYRAALASSEEIVAGRNFTVDPTVPPPTGSEPSEITIEERFAERMELTLGDVLTFDLQGVKVSGKVVGLRRINWTSFQPNFFVTFQPGVLDDAPKTFVAAIPAVDLAGKIQVEQALVRDFPNVSVIDVAKTVQRLLELVAQMQKTLSIMAGMALVTGLAVLFAIARYQGQRRIHDITLLKVLGSRFSDLRLTAVLEFGVLGAAAALLGALMGIAAAMTLAWVLFDQPWVFSWQLPLITTVLITALTTVTGFWAASSSLGASPAGFLRQPGN